MAALLLVLSPNHLVTWVAKQHPTLEKIFGIARRSNLSIALPEADDERIVAAAQEIARQGLGHPVLIAGAASHGEAARLLGDTAYQQLSLSDLMKNIPGGNEDAERIKSNAGITLLTIKQSDDKYIEQLIQQTKANGEFIDKQNKLHLTALLLHAKLIDGVIAGAATASSEVIRAGLKIVGLASGIKTLSSCFLMLNAEHALTFADCAIVPEPTPQQLADIAVSAAQMHEKLCGSEAKIALLSFSTHGSAQHPAVDAVRAAVEIIKERQPNLKVDGELQFDAAIDATIAARKALTSEVAGRANVFIFPDLNSGNIGYKLAQRLSGMSAIGPLIMGLNAPLMDLSRGAQTDEIVATAAIIAALKNDL